MAALRGLRGGLSIKSSVWGGTNGSYEERQTDAEFVTAAKFKGAPSEAADTAILHPTAGDAAAAFVFSHQPTEALGLPGNRQKTPAAVVQRRIGASR